MGRRVPRVDDNELWREVEAAVLREVGDVGPAGVNKGALVQRFRDRGAGRTTLYRWIDAVLKGPKPGRMVRQAASKAAKRRAKSADPAAAVAAKVARVLPSAHKIADEIVAPSGSSGLPFIKRLQECLANADLLLKHAQTEDGKVRNSKLLLAASEHVRRTLETAARIQDSLVQGEQLERFHQAIFDALREESPVMAERVLIRLRQVNAQFSADG
jgi:hypothetical protein